MTNTTDLVLADHPNGLVPAQQPATPTATSLVEWAAELTAAGQLAVELCKTPFVPDHFRGKPADAAAAILTGFELGLSPMAALRAIFVIKGTPGMYAKSMVAVLQGHGHTVHIEDQSKDRAVVVGWRKDNPSMVYRTVWDRDRVVAAKLTANAKYQESPQQMYVARGQAEICRQVASDALHGIPYSVEELYDMPAAGESTFQRVTAAEITGVAPAAIEAGPTVEPDEPMMPGHRQRRMFALFKERGITDKEDMLQFIGAAIGRTIASRKEMTQADGEAVIAELELPPAAEPVRAELQVEVWPETAEVPAS